MKQILALTAIVAFGCLKPSFALLDKEEKLVSANNDFALRFFKILPSSQTENVFFSPYSLSAALGMTYAAARGTTQLGMSQALGYTEAGLSDADVMEAFAKQNFRLQIDANRVGLEVANGAAIQEGFTILDSYYDALSRGFEAQVFQLNFGRRGHLAVNTINWWVKQSTHDKIDKLLDGSLDASTKLVLLNALVFKGLWASQFRREHTEKGFFYNGGQERTEVDVMFERLKTNNAYDESLRARVVELLYQGDDYSMLIVLPSERTGVEALKQDLTSTKLDAVTASLRNTTILLHLPKFKLDKQNNLKSNLETLGLGEIFGRADLSGVTGNPELVVSDVVQRAVVTVDEEGTEAAAATGVTVNRTGTEPPAVNVDHPFLFFIRHRMTREILFAGQVNKL